MSSRILLIEDDTDPRAEILEYMARRNHRVTTCGIAALASSGNCKALAMPSHLAPVGAAGIGACEAARQYDLLMIDVVMPGLLNSGALADDVGRRWPKTKVVFMSGYTGTAMVHHGQLDPGVLLLSKPFRECDLCKMVPQALNASSSSRPRSRCATCSARRG